MNVVFGKNHGFALRICHIGINILVNRGVRYCNLLRMGCSYSQESKDDVSNQRVGGLSDQRFDQFDNSHFVALTSSTYGMFNVDDPKQAEDYWKAKTGEDSLNEVYQKIDEAENQGLKSWSEMSKVLSKVKTDAEKNTGKPIVSGKPALETISVQDLMDDLVEDKEMPQQEDASPKVKHEIKREGSIIHTLEEVDQIVKSHGEERDSLSEAEDMMAWQSKILPPREEPPPKILTEEHPLTHSSRPPVPSSGLKSKLFKAFSSTSKKSDRRASMSSTVPYRSASDLGDSLAKKNRPLSTSVRPGALVSSQSTVSQSSLFDPEFLASFQQAFDHMSGNVWSAMEGKSVGNDSQNMAKEPQASTPEIVGGLKQVPKVPVKKEPDDPFSKFEKKCPPDGEQKVVLYSTTLRGIRKTFEDCNSLRSIIESFGVEIDERDISLDASFREELKNLMEKAVPVPRLFIKGRYIGGAEEVLQLNEIGVLAKLLDGLPSGVLSKDCDGCGGSRFIPCTDCNGSCKFVAETGKIYKCPECNENGLIRCPICS